jgi:hypothetical protein
MMAFCKQCGQKLNEDQSFCKNCGSTIGQNPNNSSSRVSLKQNENHSVIMRSEVKKSSKRTKIVVYSIIGIGLLLGAEYYIMDYLKDPKLAVNGHSQTKKEKRPEKAGTEKIEKPGKEKEAVASNEADIFESYTTKLNGLAVQNGSQSITVGDWNITNNNGTMIFEAKKIPSENLENIFNLYDAGNIEPLRTWAKEVFLIVDELAGKLDEDWNIQVGNNCSGLYPKSLSSSDIMDYSSACGYSVPVLTGSNKENLSLIIIENVFSNNESATNDSIASEDYILPYSSEKRLVESEIDPLNSRQLRLARNEIYALHGRIFVSEDLQQYFSEKSWYIPNAEFKDELSEIEKYNVALIKSREDQIK